ncbi:MAG: MBL fold metallo-hydrolase [Halieaceae bacterium]|nr:MBL fold metallo-hydrolase [Halieaceae bacterium]
MLLRQLFNHATFGYTYVLADPESQEAALIDPVLGKMKDYVQLFNELGLVLTAAIDTHTHDDHKSALPQLRALWHCETIAGQESPSEDISRRVADGDSVKVGDMALHVLHTPGHTEDSYSFLIERPGRSAVFTGDTLLVRTVGLSNQPTSNPRMHYDSLHNILGELAEETIVYPGRDFKGWPLSTIREEKAFNPYLLVESLDEFIELKAKQRPADITPTLVDEEDAADLPSNVPGAPPGTAAPAGDFYLPGEKGLRAVDAINDEEGTPITSWR